MTRAAQRRTQFRAAQAGIEQGLRRGFQRGVEHGGEVARLRVIAVGHAQAPAFVRRAGEQELRQAFGLAESIELTLPAAP